MSTKTAKQKRYDRDAAILNKMIGIIEVNPENLNQVTPYLLEQLVGHTCWAPLSSDERQRAGNSIAGLVESGMFPPLVAAGYKSGSRLYRRTGKAL